MQLQEAPEGWAGLDWGYSLAALSEGWAGPAWASDPYLLSTGTSV